MNSEKNLVKMLNVLFAFVFTFHQKDLILPVKNVNLFVKMLSKIEVKKNQYKSSKYIAHIFCFNQSYLQICSFSSFNHFFFS